MFFKELIKMSAVCKIQLLSNLGNTKLGFPEKPFGFFHANNRTIAKEIKAGIFFHDIVQIGIIIL